MQENIISFKPMEIEDGKFLYDIFQCKEYGKMFYEEDTDIDTWKKPIEKMKNNPKSHQFIVYRENEPIGWTGYTDDENEESLASLQIIIIKLDYLGSGYGTLILDNMKDLLRDSNKKKLKLWTQEYNMRAQKCYLRNGFKIIGREKAEVNGGEAIEDFFIMECDL